MMWIAFILGRSSEWFGYEGRGKLLKSRELCELEEIFGELLSIRVKQKLERRDEKKHQALR